MSIKIILFAFIFLSFACSIEDNKQNIVGPSEATMLDYSKARIVSLEITYNNTDSKYYISSKIENIGFQNLTALVARYRIASSRIVGTTTTNQLFSLAPLEIRDSEIEVGYTWETWYTLSLYLLRLSNMDTQYAIDNANL